VRAAIARSPVGAPRERTSDRAAVARQLRILERLFDGLESKSARSPLLAWTVRIVLTAAVGKALLHGVASAGGYPIAPLSAPMPVPVHWLMFLGFLGPGLLMLTAGRRDRRAMYLGGFFIVLATAFVRESGRRLGADLPGVMWSPIRLVLFQNLDAFLPLLLWLFAAEFPRTARASGMQRVIGHAIRLAAVCAGTLTLFDAANHAIGIWPDPVRSMMAVLGVVGRSNAYWGITFGLTAAAFPVILIRSRSVAGPERVRATWFALSLLVGLGPLLLEVIAESLSPAFERWAQSDPVRPVLGTALFLLCLTIPATATYAVVFKRVLAVKVVVRRALQCALTKHLFVAASVIPLLAVAGRMYSHRDHTVVDLASDPALRALIVLAFAGVLALVFTERILERIDAVFFAPRYDTKAILAELTPRLARAADSTALTQLLCRDLGRVLQPFNVTVAVVAAAPMEAAGRPINRLPADSILIDVMAGLRASDLDVSERLLRCVSVSDAAWLAKTGAQLLVPVKSWDGTVLGLVALAERMDELPYSAEDRDFLATVAAAAALALEKQRLRRKAPGWNAAPRDVDLAAFECRACGVMSAASGPSQCAHCGEPLELSCLPLNLHGKFRVVRRLGQGGMGIVYLAVDVALNRPVALKTLPYASRAAEQRLQGEARTMARLTHANLASIYGYDKWNDRPLLIAEYLEKGTLSARLADRRPLVAEVVGWGVDLCDGLQCLHEHALLHGDIKPSNIGFDRAGTPKLLDFGLTEAFSADARVRHRDVSGARWGTRRYACPEAAATAPCPQFDLWSLAVVLYEAIAGAWPFPGEVAPPRAVPDIREYRREVPNELANVLANALHLDIERRARSAVEFSLWLHHAQPVG
jgi:hypothetical protein